MLGVKDSTMINAFTPNTSCRLAESAADREEVYRLRYRCYRRKVSIRKAQKKRFPMILIFLSNSF
jgi:hypothetical protein